MRISHTYFLVCGLVLPVATINVGQRPDVGCQLHRNMFLQHMLLSAMPYRDLVCNALCYKDTCCPICSLLHPHRCRRTLHAYAPENKQNIAVFSKCVNGAYTLIVVPQRNG